MKRHFTSLILGFVVAAVTGASAQTTADSSRTRAYLSAHVGTSGAGLDVKVAVTPAFGFRAGASILPFDYNTVMSVRAQPAKIDIQADFNNAHLILDWHPFLKEKGLSKKAFVSLGAGYFWKAEGTGTASYDGTYQYGDISIPSSELGELTGVVEWNKVAPYAGIGFANPFPMRKVNVSFSVGAFYMGRPDATLTGTKLLVNTQANQRQFDENMSFYRFLPVAQVSLNFSLF
ncbi:hypothetical protein C7T94_04840 [Pedobacter yulinensis]|uniref:Outer membrane protein beta-barrel domain-containing protein n=1 Tax=Pedobacter yulinensis TaxID=2126353 RepID=A0A2T3HNN9_9SPHI|nr:hypothetical protein [Pedobacter yulinensis]PST84065.1 hypothetical protein C7T94_04840 [Pedobacter yulinensis]